MGQLRLDAPRPFPGRCRRAVRRWKAGRSRVGEIAREIRSCLGRMTAMSIPDCESCAAPSAGEPGRPLTARISVGRRRSSGARAAATTASCPGAEGAAQAGRPAARRSSSSPASAVRRRFPYYMNTYGIHTHPRAGAGGRHGAEMPPARPVGVGRHRRRRRLLDRHQPPHPLHPPQPGRQHPAVQQPHLRADQGPVFAHLASSARGPSPARWAPSSSPSSPCRSPWRPRPRLSPGRCPPIRPIWAK